MRSKDDASTSPAAPAQTILGISGMAPRPVRRPVDRMPSLLAHQPSNPSLSHLIFDFQEQGKLHDRFNGDGVDDGIEFSRIERIEIECPALTFFDDPHISSA